MSITQSNRSDQISNREEIIVDMAQRYYPDLYPKLVEIDEFEQEYATTLGAELEKYRGVPEEELRENEKYLKLVNDYLQSEKALEIKKKEYEILKQQLMKEREDNQMDLIMRSGISEEMFNQHEEEINERIEKIRELMKESRNELDRLNEDPRDPYNYKKYNKKVVTIHGDFSNKLPNGQEPERYTTYEDLYPVYKDEELEEFQAKRRDAIERLKEYRERIRELENERYSVNPEGEVEQIENLYMHDKYQEELRELDEAHKKYIKEMNWLYVQKKKREQEEKEAKEISELINQLDMEEEN